MSKEVIKVPDLGGAEAVEVIEIAVASGDSIAVDDTLVVLESDKASMDVPSPKAGKVVEVLVKEGDSLSEGDAILEIEIEDASGGDDPQTDSAEAQVPESDAPESDATESDDSGSDVTESEANVPKVEDKTESHQSDGSAAVETVQVPDIGTEDAVDIVEVAVAVGDHIEEGGTLVVLESDKSSMELPSTFSGEVKEILVKEGGQVKQGDAIAKIATNGKKSGQEETSATKEQATSSDQQQPLASSEKSLPADEAPATDKKPQPQSATEVKTTLQQTESDPSDIYAGPAVRQLARELGVDLRQVKGSGPKSRILKEDVSEFVKKALKQPAAAAVGAGIPQVPDMDFSAFGPVEDINLSKIAQLTAQNMVRNWLNVPAVTQFDDADITDMEAFRKGLKAEAEQRGTKLTPLPFLVLACAKALAANPVFNRSWHSSGKKVIQKHYVHIGMAVDTPRGLLVPVIRDADKKGLWELAEEINLLSTKAREGKLSMAEMQGGCFSISSLGAAGGTGFTPIVNSPEAAILGVSKAAVKPVWNGSEFAPRQLLPLSLTYDHRIVNGADAGRFMTYLVGVIADLRRLLL